MTKQILTLPNYQQNTAVTYLVKNTGSENWYFTNNREEAFSNVQIPKGCDRRGVPKETLEAQNFSENFVFGQLIKNSSNCLLILTNISGKDKTGRIPFLSWIIRGNSLSEVKNFNYHQEIPEILKKLPDSFSEAERIAIENSLERITSQAGSRSDISKMFQKAEKSSYQWYASVPLLGAAILPDSQQPSEREANFFNKRRIVIGVAALLALITLGYLTYHRHKANQLANSKDQVVQTAQKSLKRA